MKIHSEDKKSFRKKGIEFQYRHNAQVVSNYDELEMVVAARKYDLLPRLIDAGKSFVLQRQRTLTFADEKGWVFVEVYEADNIALDSEDDRKIKKCEKRAKELIDQRYKKKQKTSNYRQNTNFNTADRRQFNSNTDSGYRQMGSNKSGSGWNQGGYIPNSQRRPGARNECYNCGSLKHFVNECPDRGDRSASRENKCELAILGTIEKFVPLSEVYKSMSHDFIPPVFVDTVYEFESITGVDISVVGRLKRGLQFMRNIQASPYICDIIDKGYVIPFVGQPSSKFFRNNASSTKHPKFVRESIDKLIYQGAVVELRDKPTIVNPLTVAERNNKLRLVLDLRYVNLFVKKRKICFENVNLALNFIKKDGFAINFDLKNGYHRVSIHPSQRSLLGFAYTDSDGV